jgi:hypothetical protein
MPIQAPMLSVLGSAGAVAPAGAGTGADGGGAGPLLFGAFVSGPAALLLPPAGSVALDLFDEGACCGNGAMRKFSPSTAFPAAPWYPTATYDAGIREHLSVIGFAAGSLARVCPTDMKDIIQLPPLL